jgi:gluconolactonase
MKKKINQSIALLFVISMVSCASKSDNVIADGAKLIQVSDGFNFTEGPAADKKGNVYFTDQPNDKIMKWNASNNALSIFKEPAGRSNGLYFDLKGSLLAAADEKNELWRIDNNGKVDTLITHFEGKKLNGPNDLWVDLKGGIYFTDPYYQRPYWEHTAPEIMEQRVYYFQPETEKVKIVAKDLVQPNGIIGTPDGKTLYVADIGDQKTYSYSINEDGTLIDKKIFTEMGSDGMTLDNKGNVYLTGNGVTVFNAKGEKIKHIPIDEEWTANVTFGGADQNILFITAKGSIYTLQMNVHGVRY